MTESYQRIADFLKTNDITGKIACAVSGGIDSLALVYLLSQIREVTGLIIDHGLRQESASEAKMTAGILRGLGIENVILRKENTIKANLQEEARKLRYELLIGYCCEHEIKYLATAHHAEDNAETFLLRLSRGSGLDGLSAISEISQMDGVTLIRPVLRYTKSELKKVLLENKINWVEDPTNKTDKYKRNKLRQALAQMEDAELVTRRINDAAENLSRVRDYLEIETEKTFWTCYSGDELDVDEFEKLHEEIAYRLLVKIILQMSGAEKKPRFEKLKRLKNDIVNGKPCSLHGLIFVPKERKVIISIEKT